MKLGFVKYFGVVALGGLILSGCSRSDADKGRAIKDVNVAVATSFAPFFKEAKEQYEVEHPSVRLVLSVAGSQILKTQIEQGSKADLFVSARKKDVDALAEQGFVAATEHLASNELIIVVNKQADQKVITPLDLGKRGVRLVMGEENSPIGEYSRKMLKKMEETGGGRDRIMTKVLANLVSNESGEQSIITKVVVGEADAGIVYRSSASSNEGKKTETLGWVLLDPAYNIRTDNYIVELRGASREAHEFANWLKSVKGKSLLQKLGYVI